MDVSALALMVFSTLLILGRLRLLGVPPAHSATHTHYFPVKTDLPERTASPLWGGLPPVASHAAACSRR